MAPGSEPAQAAKSAGPSPLDAAQVASAVAALKKHLAKEAAAKNGLFEEDDMFNLVIALKKTPQEAKPKPYRIEVPHPIWQTEGSEVCLFVKDHQGEGSAAAKARVAADPARCGVAKVIGYSKLKANYKAHEARRRLCASYDLFLSDDRILPLLPKLLGKAFFKKKKQPIPVDLAHEDWATAVQRATSGAYFFVSAGGCSAVRCARASQSAEEVAANALAAAAGVAARIPKGWKGIRALYLKTNASVALPIYAALPDASEAVAPKAAEAAPAPKAAAKSVKSTGAKPPPPAAAAAAAAAPAPAPAKAKAKAAPAAAAPPAAAKKRPAAAEAVPPPAKRAAAASAANKRRA